MPPDVCFALDNAKRSRVIKSPVTSDASATNLVDVNADGDDDVDNVNDNDEEDEDEYVDEDEEVTVEVVEYIDVFRRF